MRNTCYSKFKLQTIEVYNKIMNLIKKSFVILIGLVSLSLDASGAASNPSLAPECKDNKDCPDRQTCRIVQNIPTCKCLTGHEFDESGHCSRQCESNNDCSYFTEECFPFQNRHRCICSYDYVWNNEYLGCVKRCSEQEIFKCRLHAEICETEGKKSQCKCTNNYLWDSHTNACMRKCTSDSNCTVGKEVCDLSVTDARCKCKSGFVWNHHYEECRESG